MARNLVICTDGTWNTPDQQDRGRVVASNVVKVCRAVAGRNARTGREQLVYYDTGVGTGGRWDRVKGGALGWGLFENVLQAYETIGAHWRPGDRLYLFGFSRGAYTARSLAGLIGLCGIPDPDRGAVADARASAHAAYRIDPRKQAEERSAAARAHLERWAQRDVDGNPFTEVWFIGVWDTVGALGIPLQGLNWFGRRRHQFHDVRLGTHVRHAFHAVAVDERRRPFTPTLWLDRQANAGQEVEQLWFPGVHSNIGGGYVDAGLSDRAFLWICARARAAGLGLNAAYMSKRVDPDYHGELRESLSLGYKALRPFVRPMGSSWRDGIDGQDYPALNERLHYSVRRRHDHATEALYRAAPCAAGLCSAFDAGRPPEAQPLAEELDFHRVEQMEWDGDHSAPARL